MFLFCQKRDWRSGKVVDDVNPALTTVKLYMFNISPFLTQFLSRQFLSHAVPNGLCTTNTINSHRQWLIVDGRYLKSGESSKHSVKSTP